jgi:ParB family chromosome partitioning protein
LADAIDSLGAATVTDSPAAQPPAEEISNVVRREEPTAPSFLERRGVAFDEIARTVKRPTIRIKPTECSIWSGNARDYESLSYERCASLIDSIKEEGGNREPVVIRRTPDGEKPYELVVGTRRHFSVSWLRENQHSPIELIARIETLDDEGAFRLADIENREREDVTDLERARNYLHAVDAYYNGVRTRMAERLAIAKQSLHNLLQLAELPDEVVGAFAGPFDLKVRHGMKLSPLLKIDEQRGPIVEEALRIAEEQSARRLAGVDPIDGARVFERLVAVSLPKRERRAPQSKPVFTSPSGDPLGLVISDSRSKGITLNINPRGEMSVDDILEALRPVIASAKFGKR